ncbi:MAG: 2-phosphosulfolactate phosphatase [Ignavibacteriales bacterium]|nr:MAG: 2-phosphosulfolactate phosphatase [Ignavibacteriales bacterium]
MKINVLFSPSLVDELYFTGKTTVVIDVLRATSTIIEALNNGAKEVIPVNTFEFALKASGSIFGGQTILGGEKNTKKIESFNLGNSPLEYTKEVVAGKSIILFTTNGSKAIVKAKFSEHLLICAFTNLSYVAKFLIENGKDFEILCSGRAGGFSIEDTICAGRLISEIEEQGHEMMLSDSGRAAKYLSKFLGKSVRKMLADSEHGKLLAENEFQADIEFCSSVNTMNLLPIYSNGSIKILPNKNESEL